MTVETLLAEHIIERSLTVCLSGNYHPKALVSTITTFRCSNRSVNGFGWISLLTNLERLELTRNSLSMSDLTAISKLTSLKYLDLENNQLSDISPLSSLVNLRELKMSSNQISDIRPLSSLVELTQLDLSSNKVVDIAAIANLHSLTFLSLHSNQISDISFVSELTELNTLYLGFNEISDISFLAELQRLIELDLRRNLIMDASALANLTSLTLLLLSDNGISDINFLRNLINLSDLIIHGSQISDITPLSNLTALTTLILNSGNISDISPLSSLTNLTSLGLSKNNIKDIAALLDLINLEGLTLGGNEISDVSALGNIYKSAFINISPENLECIDYADPDEELYNHLPESCWLPMTIDVFLQNYVVDEKLSLCIYKEAMLNSWNDISEITFLSCESSGITYLDGMEYLTSIKDLELSGNQINDLSPLLNIYTIANIRLQNNPIMECAFNSSMGETLYNEVPERCWLEKMIDTFIADYIVDPNLAQCIKKNAESNKWVKTQDVKYLECRDGYGITNLSGIERLPMVWGLFFSNNNITDIHALSSLPNLAYILLNNNKISDISDISDLKSLSNIKKLDLANNQIVNVSALSELYQSADINLDGNPVTDLIDSDHDGIDNAVDNCTYVANSRQWDKDQDGEGNACDSDIDGDGFSNQAEDDAGSNVWNASSTPETILLDDDNDGINNADDNCIHHANPKQWNKDGDEFGNACDDDIDGDGFSNEDEIAIGTKPWDAGSKPEEGDLDDDDQDGVLNGKDNCRTIANQGQWDKDNDGIGNECDDDIDGDGVKNQIEIDLGTLPWNFDSKPDAAFILDSDDDGILDSLDNCIAIVNPKQWNKDGDAFGNECDDDIDGDGFTNQQEIAAGTKVWDARSFPQ